MPKTIVNPLSALLSNCKLELPGIVFVIFVQVSAVKEPVSKAYPCAVPSNVLISPKKFCATLDFTQNEKVIKLELDL